MKQANRLHEMGMSWSKASHSLLVSLTTLNRWRKRNEQGVQLINKPGPQKTIRPDMSRISEELDRLKICKKRVMGTTAIYRKYKNEISRRDLQEIIDQKRINKNIERQTRHQELLWLTSKLVLAFDETEIKNGGAKIIYLTIRDLCSSYKFSSIFGESIDGKSAADQLEKQFRNHGAPLFLKRDNGSALNAKEVDDVLSKYLVIPINSPSYYPKYNGAVEHDQREIKTNLLGKAPELIGMKIAMDNNLHELNHMPRRKLSGRCSCTILNAKSRQWSYDIRQRRAIYDEIMQNTISLLQHDEIDEKIEKSDAWRESCQKWLVENGHLIIKNRIAS